MSRLIVVIALLLEPAIILASSLPDAVGELSTPYAWISHHQELNNSEELERVFETYDYTMAEVERSGYVPPLFVTNLPNDLSRLTVPQKTSLFIRLLLPTVMRVNSDVLAVRRKIEKLATKIDGKSHLSPDEQQWLTSVTVDYGTSPGDLQELLSRADEIPVGLNLAQAIDESGWGTSSFAIKGNAIYGQHGGRNESGSYLTASGNDTKVAAFDNLYDAAASYVHNLNTAMAYERLRQERAGRRRGNQPVYGYELAETLQDYSARGEAYVDTLRRIMKNHNLDELNRLRSSETFTPLLLKVVDR